MGRPAAISTQLQCPSTRDDPAFEVVAFHCGQIPGIAEPPLSRHARRPALCGRHSRSCPEAELEALIRRQTENRTDRVRLTADPPCRGHWSRASRALAVRSRFSCCSARSAPCIAAGVPGESQYRGGTGCGKSPVSRWLSRDLRSRGPARPPWCADPMPLWRSRAPKRASVRDARRSGRAPATIEEREEYEPHLRRRNIVYAGVDYRSTSIEQTRSRIDSPVGRRQQRFSLRRPDLHNRAGRSPCARATNAPTTPGETVLRHWPTSCWWRRPMRPSPARVPAGDRQRAPREFVRSNPARVHAVCASTMRAVAWPPPCWWSKTGHDSLRRHGPRRRAMSQRFASGCRGDRDPRAFARRPKIAAVYAQYPHIGPVLPAMGYSRRQLEALRQTINKPRADVVVAATRSTWRH